jgi:urocanate hydratase
LQGTYETFAAIGAKRGGTLAGTISLTAGLGGWAAHSRSRSR